MLAAAAAASLVSMVGPEERAGFGAGLGAALAETTTAGVAPLIADICFLDAVSAGLLAGDCFAGGCEFKDAVVADAAPSWGAAGGTVALAATGATTGEAGGGVPGVAGA